MTKQEREAARHWVVDLDNQSLRQGRKYLNAALDALDARDECIRRLIDWAGQPLVQDEKQWQVAVADAERELGGTP